MKSEAELCTVIVKSFTYGYKIPDESGFQYGAHTGIRCFDGIATQMLADGLHFICWEAKYLKSPGAFSFKRIEPHQNFNLIEFRKAKEVLSYVIVGIDYGRADKRVFVFDWTEDFSNLYKIGFSIHLKELEKLPYNKISKGTFNFDNIITYDMLKKLYPNFEDICNDFKKKMEIANGKSNI